MKFDVYTELDDKCTTVCCMTQSKVKIKVTSIESHSRGVDRQSRMGLNLFVLQTSIKSHFSYNINYHNPLEELLMFTGRQLLNE